MKPGAVLRFIFFAASLARGMTAWSGEPDTLWTAVGLKPEVLRPVLNEVNCYASDKNFLGCIAAFRLLAQSVPSSIKGSDLEKLGALQNFVSQEEKGAEPTVTEFRAKRDLQVKTALDLYSATRQEAMQLPFSEALRQLAPELGPNSSAIVGGAYSAYLSAILDPHSYLMPSKYYDEMGSGETHYSGIGMLFDPDSDHKRVLEVIDGGPAARAGIRPGDDVVEIDGIDVTRKSTDSVVGMILGKEGSELRLTLSRGKEKIELKLTRTPVSVKNVTSRLIEGPDSSKLGYIKLRSFDTDQACSQVLDALYEVIGAGAKTLVLDLRNNPGGLVTQAVCTASLFIPRGKEVVTIRDTSGKVVGAPFRTARPRRTALPLVVLINSHTASAAEILSGTLQDYQRAIIVGERSFGKGSVQDPNQTEFRPEELKGFDLKVVKTVGLYFLPSGRSPQIRGIMPDFEAYLSPEGVSSAFAFREEDEFVNALPPPSEPYVSANAVVVPTIQKCISESGKSRTVFEANPRESDYSLLVGADVVSCLAARNRAETHAH